MNTTFHDLKIKSHLADPYIDVILDGRTLNGVTDVKLNITTGSVPLVSLTLMCADAEIDIGYMTAYEDTTTGPDVHCVSIPKQEAEPPKEES